MSDFRKLVVYKRMLELVKLVYELTQILPSREQFSLTDQMRRAAISVVSNFAEGYRKGSSKEKYHFLEIAMTSLTELEAQADVCIILKYWKETEYDTFISKKGEVGYLLYKYMQRVK